MAKANGKAASGAVRKEAEKLREELRRHEYLYYVQDEPEITDAAYDRLMNRLKEIEAAHPELQTADSPTVRVGGTPREGFQTVKHARAMLSLDNAYSYEQLRDWDRRVREGSGREEIEYIAEHKFDGLSISLQYEEGVLVRGVTRGDGATGEDVTPNVKTIRSVPLRVDAGALKKLKLSADFEVRGEIMMTRKSFEALNRQQEEAGGKLFVNPRNAAAGAVSHRSQTCYWPPAALHCCISSSMCFRSRAPRSSGPFVPRVSHSIGSRSTIPG